MNEFLKSKKLYMLFMLPVIAAAIAFLSEYFPEIAVPSATGEVKGLIDFTFIHKPDKWNDILVTFGIILIVAYIMFGVNERHRFLSQTTTLPSLIFVLLTSGAVVSVGFGYLLISVFVLLFALERLQLAIRNTQNNSSIFDFGCFIMFAVAIYPKCVILLLWSICVLFFSGRSTFKDVVALLLGWITTSLFIGFYYFWTDRLLELPQIFTESLLSGEYIQSISYYEMGRLGILFILLMAALRSIMMHYPVSIVYQRRGILSVVSLLIFIIVGLVVVPGCYDDYMYILALPLSFIYAQYFITNKRTALGNLMFILLLGACCLAYLI